jgi:perosamine synthetase
LSIKKAEITIPVAAPALVGRELEYLQRCVTSTWVSSLGEFIGAFERGFAQLCQVGCAVAVSAGTAALHVALLALGVEPGDEVIVPTLSYLATAGAVVMCGATPVFVDCDPRTWNIDPTLVSEAVTPRTKGMLPVHLYGEPADMDPLCAIADEHELFLLEDAAQAHGATYRGRPVGSLGDAAIFSFYGNKVITTGEGGMVVTDDPEIASTCAQLRNQGQDARYHVARHGFNYRMTNTAAAIGLAQLERIDWHLERRRENARAYRAALEGHRLIEFQQKDPSNASSDWLTSILISEEAPVSRDELAARLEAAGIQTRPVFPPIHTQPVYADRAAVPFPNAERISARGLSLPSGALLTQQDIATVVGEVLESL